METVSFNIRQDGDEEFRFLSLRWENPTPWLTEEIQPMDEGYIRPVLLREPLDHLGATLFSTSNLVVVVTTDHKVVDKPRHVDSLIVTHV